MLISLHTQLDFKIRSKAKIAFIPHPDPLHVIFERDDGARLSPMYDLSPRPSIVHMPGGGLIRREMLPLAPSLALSLVWMFAK